MSANEKLVYFYTLMRDYELRQRRTHIVWLFTIELQRL